MGVPAVELTFLYGPLADPDLRRAIADYLKRERAYVAEVGRELTEAGPFRKEPDEA